MKSCRLHPHHLLVMLSILALLSQALPLRAQCDTSSIVATMTVADIVEQASMAALQLDEIEDNTLLLGDKNPDIQHYFGVQTPMAAGALGWGSGVFFSSEWRVQNKYIREEVQLWRRNNLNDWVLPLDNVTQILPAASLFVLQWAGVESKHDFWSMARRTASSYLFVTITSNTLKISTGEMRPDRTNYRSFPSGHTAFAFAGAELLRLEYGETSIWIPIAGYSVAALTGFMRIYNDRHWFNDVMAGAGIGILCVDLTYWINDLIFDE